ncbi:MAG: hypothetical protein HWN66_03425 [Candidatus Helarchaeota archaeon]|nr:hypothetical protein [Candidatus Helarchaeota archaeon]
MESKKKIISALGIAGIIITSMILVVVLLPRPAGPINLWTWVSGNYSANQLGSYGQQGVPAATNVPGARAYSVSWTDTAGNLWLFGGDGYDNASVGLLNDLWKYSP